MLGAKPEPSVGQDKNVILIGPFKTLLYARQQSGVVPK